MRKSTIALGISAALAAQALLDPTSAAAAPGIRNQAGHPNRTPQRLRAPAGAVLYDQSGTVVNGAPSQNFSSTYDQYDNASADDFVVTDANGWDISQFNFSVTSSAGGDPSSATYDITVYNDAGGLPGTPTSCAYSALAGTVTGGTALSVALPAACHLDPGTYWISEVANLDFGVGGQLFWSDVDPGIAAINSPGVFQNPGDGFGTGCTTWSPLASCGQPTPVGGGSNNFIFQVLGAVSGGGGGCTSGGICLDVTLAEDNGDPAQCGTSDSLDASVGDQINFCYTVTNESGVTLNYHTLMDNIDGTIFSLVNVVLADGASYQYNRVVTAGSTETVTSTWTAQDLPPGYTATATTGGGGGDCIFKNGFDDGTNNCGGSGDGFVDITGSGTATNLSDDATLGVTMPFSFSLYGTTSNNVCIGNNGGIIFGVSSCSLGFTNSSLPNAGLGAAILPLWDDFDSETGNVYYATVGTAPNRKFIVEWYDRVHFNGASNTDGATFEAILNEDGTIQFEYADVDYTALGNIGGDPEDCTDGVCATIGLQQNDTAANQYSFNTASISSGSGILWEATTPQIFTDDDTVNLNVGAPIIEVSPTSLSGTTPAGGTSTAELDIANIGNRDLNWNLQEAGPATYFPPPGTRFAMPLGDTSKTTTKPYLGRDKGLSRKPFHGAQAPFGTGGTAPAFAVDVYNTQFVSFDAAAPATENVISSIANSFYAGDFVDGDFSKLYAIDGNSASATYNEFATIDTTTGAVTAISTTPASTGGDWTGLSWDPTTNTLFGEAVVCGSSSSLYTIDPGTGAATLIGTSSDAPCMIDIAVSPTGAMYGVDIVNDALYAIDKTSGAVSLIGSIGFNANYAMGLDFDDATGILYFPAFNADLFQDNMYTVDLNTGATTLISPIGPSLGEIGAMGIATGGGPCSQPQDLPWLSLSPISGTTAPSGSDPVTVTFNATGLNDGDVLDGTVCVHSNDPDNSTVAVPVEMTVGGGGGGNIIDSGQLDIAVIQDFTGLYINWLTGDTCDSTTDTGGASCQTFAPQHFNMYGTSTLTFFWPSSNGSNCVSSGGSCVALTSGATIGAGSTFATGNDNNFNITGTQYLGFSFPNTDTGMTNYGYVELTTTAPDGQPIVFNRYWYDNSGADITIP